MTAFDFLSALVLGATLVGGLPAVGKRTAHLAATGSAYALMSRIAAASAWRITLHPN